MNLKIIKKQNNSEDCVVCGFKNNLSLKTKYYELEEKILCGIFHNNIYHQSFPQRMHGGMISAVLDETIGRAIMIENPNQFGVTGELNVRFLKPTPLNVELFSFAKIVFENKKIFKGIGFIENSKGEILATASATYFKMDIKNITTKPLSEYWCYEDKEKLKFIDCKNKNMFKILEQKLIKK